LLVEIDETENTNTHFLSSFCFHDLFSLFTIRNGDEKVEGRRSMFESFGTQSIPGADEEP
jgi:hypothetical protein